MVLLALAVVNSIKKLLLLRANQCLQRRNPVRLM